MKYKGLSTNRKCLLDILSSVLLHCSQPAPGLRQNPPFGSARFCYLFSAASRLLIIVSITSTHASPPSDRDQQAVCLPFRVALAHRSASRQLCSLALPARLTTRTWTLGAAAVVAAAAAAQAFLHWVSHRSLRDSPVPVKRATATSTTTSHPIRSHPIPSQAASHRAPYLQPAGHTQPRPPLSPPPPPPPP